MNLEDQDHRPVENAAAIDGGAGRVETLPNSVLLDALAEFAAGLGHEINNPLAIISGHAQILLQEAEGADERRHLAVILAQVKRSYEMIADVRLFSRPPQPQITVFRARQWLASSLDVWEEDHVSPAVSLVRLPFDGEEESFASDPAMLGTILGALLKNASEALVSQRGVIQVSGRCREGYLLFSVEDDGPGIAEEIRPHIFSPYFSGRSAGRGLGFGLPKAYALTRALGGTITLEDTPGCRVVVRVPNAASKEGIV